MSRTLKVWFAILFLFAGTMSLLFASGAFRRGESADAGNVQAMTVVDDDAPSDVGTVGGTDAESNVGHNVNDDAIESTGDDVGEFVFTTQKGKKFSSTSLKGKIWVGSIFYATCPGTCRIQNTRVAELQNEFGEKGVEFVSITCDPDKDTPSALNDYSKMFGAQADKWHFLTGDFELARKIGEKKFGITVLPQTHSDRLVLFGKDGAMAGRYRSLEPEQFTRLKEEIRKLLGDDSSAAADADTEKESGTAGVAS